MRDIPVSLHSFRISPRSLHVMKQAVNVREHTLPGKSFKSPVKPKEGIYTCRRTWKVFFLFCRRAWHQQGPVQVPRRRNGLDFRRVGRILDFTLAHFLNIILRHVLPRIKVGYIYPCTYWESAPQTTTWSDSTPGRTRQSFVFSFVSAAGLQMCVSSKSRLYSLCNLGILYLGIFI